MSCYHKGLEMKCKLDTAIELHYHFIIPHLVTLCVFHAPRAYLRPFDVPAITIVDMQLSQISWASHCSSSSHWATLHTSKSSHIHIWCLKNGLNRSWAVSSHEPLNGSAWLDMAQARLTSGFEPSRDNTSHGVAAVVMMAWRPCWRGPWRGSCSNDGAATTTMMARAWQGWGQWW